MKKVNITFITILMIALQGCLGTKPKLEDIIGHWISEDGEEFFFRENGDFSATNIKGSNFFPIFEEYDIRFLLETGSWKIERRKGMQWTEIVLDFDASDTLVGGYSGVKFIVSGKGLFENRPPWKIFIWVDEPGGTRHVFRKVE